MNISLIITTYNNVDTLRLTMQTALNQTLLPSEIIIADDGSTSEIADLVKTMRQNAEMPVYHCWQEDEGFRPARCRNMAMARSMADYCILVDGDIMLDKHFVEDHLHYATPGYFVQGSRVILSKKATEQIIKTGDVRVSLFGEDVGNRKNCIRSRFLSKILSFRNSRVGGIKTCNFAFWKNDAIKVNGFNEDFIGWGHEDTEFAARLLNVNVRRQNVKFNALAFHLYHPSQSRDYLQQNNDLLSDSLERKKKWCENGLDKHIGNCKQCT